MVDAFEPAFMQRALIGSLLAVVATSLVGTWVVLRGLAFLGDAIAHGVIPGIALAVLWGFSPIIGALAAAALMAGLVSVVSARTVIREDTGIGLLFVGMLSLGIVIVSKARSFTTEVTSLALRRCARRDARRHQRPVRRSGHRGHRNRRAVSPFHGAHVQRHEGPVTRHAPQSQHTSHS